jgi:hypothetical protein
LTGFSPEGRIPWRIPEAEVERLVEGSGVALKRAGADPSFAAAPSGPVKQTTVRTLTAPVANKE